MLEKDDLRAIEKIIDKRAKETEKSVKKYVDNSGVKLESGLKKYVDESNTKQELNLKDYVGFEIEKSEMKLIGQMEKMEDRIVSRINREITDMAENVRTIATKIDKVDDHEKRIRKLETAPVKC